MHPSTSRNPPHWFASGRAGAIATAFPEATAIGLATLRAGGNAVDAACAAAWALGVCEPAESGLGGQAMALVHAPDGRIHVIDGHSAAPRGATRERVSRRDQRRGIRSTTVPSMPATLDLLRRRFGTQTNSETIGPAAELAARGHCITALQRRQIGWTREALAACPLASRRWLVAGQPLPVGHRCPQPELAATLARLAREGVDDFYQGGIAAAIVQDMNERGGLIDADDLAAVAARETVPIEIEWRGHRVVGVPPPGGGVQTLLALLLMDRRSAAGVSLADIAHDPERFRAEAVRAAFRERERWPDHPRDLTPALRQWLVSEERVARLSPLLALRPQGGVPIDRTGEAGDTTHLCVADRHGWVVSLTQSIQSVFGAKTASPTAGFFYNNFLKTCPRGRHAYRLGPGALPQSNASPTLVLAREGDRWRPRLAIGAAGSRRLTSAIVQILDAVIGRGVALPEAVRAPRMHALLDRGVWIERPALGPAGPAGPASLSRAFGPVRVLSPLSYKAGAAQAIAFEPDGSMVAVADPRRDGSAAALRDG